VRCRLRGWLSGSGQSPQRVSVPPVRHSGGQRRAKDPRLRTGSFRLGLFTDFSSFSCFSCLSNWTPLQATHRPLSGCPAHGGTPDHHEPQQHSRPQNRMCPKRVQTRIGTFGSITPKRAESLALQGILTCSPDGIGTHATALRGRFTGFRSYPLAQRFRPKALRTLGSLVFFAPDVSHHFASFFVTFHPDVSQACPKHTRTRSAANNHPQPHLVIGASDRLLRPPVNVAASQ